MGHAGPLARWAALLVVGMAGCGGAEPGEEPILPETGVVVVHATPGARLCAGTEAWAEAEVERVSSLIGMEPLFELPVTLGRRAVEERCDEAEGPDAVLGCRVGEGAATAVYSTPQAMSHELVHALRRHSELRTQPMLEEGFAELVNGSDAHPRFTELDPTTVPDDGQPEALVQQSTAEFRRAYDYRTATHWFDFVAAQYSEAEVATFMRGGIDDSGEEVGERFERHFGSSLAAIADAWREEGLVLHARGELCAGGGEPVTGEGITLVATVDCDEPGTMGLLGAGEVAWVRRCLELPAGLHTVELRSDSGVARLDAVPGSCDEEASAVARASKEVAAGASGQLELGACTWAVTFESTVDQPVTFELSIQLE